MNKLAVSAMAPNNLLIPKEVTREGSALCTGNKLADNAAISKRQVLQNGHKNLRNVSFKWSVVPKQRSGGR